MGRCELFGETDERRGGEVQWGGNNVVHEFFSGEGVQSVSTNLLRALDKLVKELKLVGYVPDISLVFHEDMEDEDKEITLRYHSEK